MLGTEAGLEKVIKALKDYITAVKKIISGLEEKLAEAYEVSSIYNAPAEINARISTCSANQTKIYALIPEIEGLKTEASSYSDIVASAEELRVSAENLKTGIGSKKGTLNNRYSKANSDLGVIGKLKEKLSAMEAELKKKEALLEQEKARRERNKRVMFDGMGKMYEQTGLDTITVIDGGGYPHILYEKDGVWKNNDDKKYESCVTDNDGLKLCI